MESFLIGFGLDFKGSIQEVLIASFPWRGIKRLSLLDSLKYANKLSNAIITDNLRVVMQEGNANGYMKYSIESGQILKQSMFILAKSKLNRGDIYFVTDSISNPAWLSEDKILRLIQQGYSLANAMISETNHVIYNRADVDIRKVQKEYREYLKNMNKVGK